MSKRYKSNFDGFFEEKPVVKINYRSWYKWSLVKLVDYLLADDTTYNTVYTQTGSKQLGDCAFLFLGNKKDKHNASVVLRGFAEARNDIFLQPEVREVIAKIITYYEFRQRDLSTWISPSRNVYKQAMSLVSHLFDKYNNCPDWLINSWFKTGVQHKVSVPELMIHIGDGKSFRQCIMPIEITKKLETALRQAPYESSLMEAIRYAQLANRNALDWFYKVNGSLMGKSFKNDDFWMTVLDFFINTAMIDKNHFAPVCDWINQKKYVGTGDEPPQPNFTLKGRTMESILLHTENWHRVLNRQRRISGTTIDFETKWEKSGLQSFEGGLEHDRYSITEITKYGDLVGEGRALHHCVGSYYQSCKSGKCAIFSFKRNTQHALTIEVENGCVTQVRGRYNRCMNPNEKGLVLKWAGLNNLTLSKYTG